MRRMRNADVLATLCLASILTGCGGGKGPITLGNIFENYPLQINGVAIDLAASLVKVRVQPYNDPDVYVSIQGWYFAPGDTGHTEKRYISFVNSVISGRDTHDGMSLFVVASYGWPGGWSGTALSPGVDYFFMITATKGDRQRVGVWEFKNGVLSQAARAIPDLAGYTGTDGHEVFVKGMPMPSRTRGVGLYGADWLAELKHRAQQ